MLMLSVFKTPWQKPTDCHSATSSALRWVTARSSARYGDSDAVKHAG